MNESLKWIIIFGAITYFVLLTEECSWMEEMWPEIDMDILLLTNIK